MDENEIPPWLANAARQVDAVIRQGMPIVRAAQQYVEEARAAQEQSGRPLLSGRDVALAMDAGMRELLAAVRKQAEQKRGISGHASSISATSASWFAAGVFEVGTATDTLTVEKGTQTDPGMPLDAKTLFLAVLWAVTIVLVLRGDQLPQEVHDKILDFLTLVNFTLTVHWRVTDGRRKRD